MEKLNAQNLPELLISDESSKKAKQISQMLKTNQCRKIAAKIYTTNTEESLEAITKRHLFH